eukprot:TRINITY_DN106340_c0_g1_i1.p1 TRINITY_DN106340_c0_g1~~TRINITY_DN106340_c0_g1_i1.p1  ORF type:complete len:910 (+),score=126.35 TRINITY_DN106340_c0_g1_i1:192-2921(+)
MADEDGVPLSLHDNQESKAEKEDDHQNVEGMFSWTAAWCMMFWVVAFICSAAMGILTFQGAGMERISQEISFIREQNPPYGPAEQPDPVAGMRDINKPYNYHLPQEALFYSLCSSALGLFTVSFFTNTMLLEGQGMRRSVDISWLISRGVAVYLTRTIPVIGMFLLVAGFYVYVTSGWGTVVCFMAGSTLNLISARVGVSMTVAGTGRLAASMSEQLAVSVQLGMRTGNIGGLLATSLALGGMAGMWFWILDTQHLSGFGSGASIVSFYMRVGGGIFSKGAEIGGNLVGDMTDNKIDEERRVFELQQRMSQMEKIRKERLAKGLADEEEDMMDQLRMMEEEMHDMASELHPIDFLDAVGENICDVSGTCADLFESMVLILSTSAIIGSKGSQVPHFLTGLPFWIVASGNIGCAAVAYKTHVNDRFSARQCRWSLRLNLLFVIVFTQAVQVGISYLEWVRGSITFDMFWNFAVISCMGQLAPEICVLFAEYFTSTDYWPIRSLAKNSHLGVVQVVLQGLGQGFISTAGPAVVMVACVLITWDLQGHYGLALLSSASVSGTGFQGGIASFGAIATNAHKIVHLTTYHSMTRHRANICAALGDATSHAGNIISSINAFSAVFNLSVTLLAQSYTRLSLNYKAVSGAPLSEWSQAGLVLGVVMSFLFTANTTLSCLETSKSFMRFCKESAEVNKVVGLPFPGSHYKALKILSSYGTVTSMRMVFSPMINTLACPMLGGFFLGTRGLLFLVTGSNVLILCFSTFLLNSGQSWVTARKFILYGLLKDKEGNSIGPDSEQFQHLGVGTMIGGPFEDTSGPALNNFIKFFGVFAFVTENLYNPTPEETWQYGFMCLFGSLFLVAFSRFGLSLLLNCVTSFMKQRAIQKEKMLKEKNVMRTTEDDEDEEEMAAITAGD